MLLRWYLIFALVINVVLSNKDDEKKTAEDAKTDDIEMEYEMDDGIVILTDKNFDSYLEKNPSVMVKFYAPWCGHCKALAPEYIKAAKEVSIPLAKVDATVETELAKRFDVKGYPTVKFWHNSADPVDYDGGRDSESIVEYIKQRTDPNYKPPPSEVVALTKETFDEFVNSKPLVLVKFYAPWCGHCKKLAPEYEKAAKRIKAQNLDIALVEVDATSEKSLADKFGVSGFPTLKVLRYGRRFDYSGPREADGIVKYMIEQSKPAAHKLQTIKEAQRYMQKQDITIIGFFASDESKLFEAFNDAAEMTREEFKLGYTLEPELIKHFKVKPNDIVIFYPEIFWSKYEPKRVVYSKGESTAEDLLTFLRDKAAPMVGQMTKDNAANRYSKFPLVVVYYNVDFSKEYRDGTQYWRNKVLDVANKYKNEKYRFAVADEEEFSKELAEVGLGDSGLEHNVIVFGYDGKKYPMDPDEYDGDLDENLAAFMKKISSGQVKPHVKSQPIPKDDKGPVKTLVSANFAKVMADQSKDVLVEFYAPWCGHCKAFEPKYKQLAAKLKTEEPNLILAKFDAIGNDVPSNYKVEGFPTIYFAPSGKRDEPIKYSGNRDLDDLTKFMKEHAVKSFKGKGKKTEL
uniref:Protein disulfide-isomerase n=1 Tax=Syphacia muris TaxID=451379 RepID=A0A0N5AJ78_9BILA